MHSTLFGHNHSLTLCVNWPQMYSKVFTQSVSKCYSGKSQALTVRTVAQVSQRKNRFGILLHLGPPLQPRQLHQTASATSRCHVTTVTRTCSTWNNDQRSEVSDSFGPQKTFCHTWHSCKTVKTIFQVFFFSFQPTVVTVVGAQWKKKEPRAALRSSRPEWTNHILASETEFHVFMWPLKEGVKNLTGPCH